MNEDCISPDGFLQKTYTIHEVQLDGVLPTAAEMKRFKIISSPNTTPIETTSSTKTPTDRPIALISNHGKKAAIQRPNRPSSPASIPSIRNNTTVKDHFLISIFIIVN